MYRGLDIAKLGQVTDSSLALLQGLTAITALKLGCNTFDIYPLTGRAFIMFRAWEHLRVLYLEACRYLQKDAYIALACSCPHLQVLHMDTASRVTPAAFALTPMCAPPVGSCGRHLHRVAKSCLLLFRGLSSSVESALCVVMNNVKQHASVRAAQEGCWRGAGCRSCECWSWCP